MQKENKKEKEKPASALEVLPVSLDLAKINGDITMQLSDENVRRTLLATTFKGLQPVVMKQAIMEGMIRGFTFKNFLEKDIYAIPFGASYSLTQSIDYIRKIGMRAGIVGKGAPEYTYEEIKGKNVVESCSITVKRRVDGYVGDYTATVYFSEFTTGRNLWATKPRMMIAKVAEMHALRMACPEVLAHAYIEEEMEKEAVIENEKARTVDAKVDSSTLKMGNFEVKNEKAKNNKVTDAVFVTESNEETFGLEELPDDEN
jgi:hypothetical protein